MNGSMSRERHTSANEFIALVIRYCECKPPSVRTDRTLWETLLFVTSSNHKQNSKLCPYVGLDLYPINSNPKDGKYRRVLVFPVQSNVDTPVPQSQTIWSGLKTGPAAKTRHGRLIMWTSPARWAHWCMCDSLKRPYVAACHLSSFAHSTQQRITQVSNTSESTSLICNVILLISFPLDWL